MDPGAAAAQPAVRRFTRDRLAATAELGRRAAGLLPAMDTKLERGGAQDDGQQQQARAMVVPGRTSDGRVSRLLATGVGSGSARRWAGPDVPGSPSVAAFEPYADARPARSTAADARSLTIATRP